MLENYINLNFEQVFLKKKNVLHENWSITYHPWKGVTIETDLKLTYLMHFLLFEDINEKK